MHKPSIDRLVYRYLFPDPKASDPTDFHDLVRKHIIPEVRNEIIRYYGSVNCLESQYPGLDYAGRGHRLRLGQFRWHRKLFAAFDNLRLTKSEIYDLCHWEGTKWAKEKYERDHNIYIRDTTWDGIPDAEPRKPFTVTRGVYTERKGGNLVPVAQNYNPYSAMPYLDAEDGQADDEESEHERFHRLVSRSMNAAFNQQVHAPNNRRDIGAYHRVPSSWDEWMKDATERGTIPSITQLGSSRRLAAYQAHIPAHYAFATPVYHYGPYSPSNYGPISAEMHAQNYLPQSYETPYQPATTNSYFARSSRSRGGRSFR